MNMANAVPLTTAIIRNKCTKLDGSLDEYMPMFFAFAQEIEKELQKYQTNVARCSVAGQVLRIVPIAEQTDGAFVFNSDRGALRIWITADRGFDGLLCEICLGGSGVAVVEQEESRPLSRFEKRLRMAAFKDVGQAFVTSARQVRDVNLEYTDQEGIALVPVEAKAESCVSLSLLVNAFTFSGSMQVNFQLDEMTNLFSKKRNETGGEVATVRGVLNTARFEIEALLAASEIPLEKIIDIRIGTVLPLDVKITGLVEVKCLGSHVLNAKLQIRENVIELMMMSKDALDKPGKTTPRNWVA